MLLPVAFQQVAVAGEYAAGRATATTALDMARRCGEPDVVPLALNLVGRSLLREGRVAEGMAALDEAMVEVVTGGVSAPVAGAVYCSLIEACEEIAEVRRAREWTDALTRWCDRHGEWSPSPVSAWSIGPTSSSCVESGPTR